MAEAKSGGAQRPREVTGRMVLFCLVAFFGTVVAVNAVMIREAVSTFGGLETESSYKAGLAFSREEAAALAQNARCWQVSAHLGAIDHGQVRIEVVAVDADKRPLAGYTATVLLAHPTDRRLDHAIRLDPVSVGRFKGTASAAPGQWDLLIEIAEHGERMFRSRERIILKAGEVK